MEWYRKESWTQEDEKDFWDRFARTRQTSRAQYLKLQAATLLWMKTINKRMLDGAEKLLNLFLKDYNDRLFLTSVYLLMGRLFTFRKETSQALLYFQKAVEHEKEFPNSKSGSFLYYAEHIVKANAKNLFAEAEKLIFKHKHEIYVVWQEYVANAVLAIINKTKGDKEKARQYKQAAENAARTTHSGLSYHPTAGLLPERDKFFEKAMKKIK